MENAIEDYKTNETYVEIHEVLRPNLIKFLPENLFKKEALDNYYNLKISYLKNYKKKCPEKKRNSRKLRESSGICQKMSMK